MLKHLIQKHLKGDKVLWMIMLLLSIASTLTVYSATGALAYKYQDGNTTYYVSKHVIIILIGFLITFVIHRINYNSIRKYAKLMLFLTLPLLLLTLVLGVSLNSAARWITIPGIGLTFQTSDFAKFSLIIYLAYFLAKNQEEIGDFKKVFMPVVGVVGMVCVLILPANFSTAALLFCVGLVMMFVGRILMKHITLLLGVCFVAIGIIATLIFVAPDFLPRGQTWKHRIENFSGGGDEGDNFQSDQSKIAIATGGIFGKGPGNSVQRNFLPHPYSDFIYAIIVEEYGLIGGMFILFMYLIILFRAGMIVRKSEYRFPSLVATGLAFSLVFQAMINMAVAVNLIPVTGQTLPLVSMGGSSIIFTSVSFGLLLSVSRCLDPEEQKVVDTQAEDEKAEKASADEKAQKEAREKMVAEAPIHGLEKEADEAIAQVQKQKPRKAKEVGVDYDDDPVEEKPQPKKTPARAKEFDPDEIDIRTEEIF